MRLPKPGFEKRMQPQLAGIILALSAAVQDLDHKGGYYFRSAGPPASDTFHWIMRRFATITATG